MQVGISITFASQNPHGAISAKYYTHINKANYSKIRATMRNLILHGDELTIVIGTLVGFAISGDEYRRFAIPLPPSNYLPRLDCTRYGCTRTHDLVSPFIFARYLAFYKPSIVLVAQVFITIFNYMHAVFYLSGRQIFRFKEKLVFAPQLPFVR